jgi:hypothetical protein
MRAGVCCRGTSAQSFAIDRDIARYRRLTSNPTAECPSQRGEIQRLEQFAPHRWGRRSVALDADGRECLALHARAGWITQPGDPLANGRWWQSRIDSLFSVTSADAISVRCALPVTLICLRFPRAKVGRQQSH